jgi:hypothetical protein
MCDSQRYGVVPASRLFSLSYGGGHLRAWHTGATSTTFCRSDGPKRLNRYGRFHTPDRHAGHGLTRPTGACPLKPATACLVGLGCNPVRSSHSFSSLAVGLGSVTQGRSPCQRGRPASCGSRRGLALRPPRWGLGCLFLEPAMQAQHEDSAKHAQCVWQPRFAGYIQQLGAELFEVAITLRRRQ